MSLVRSDVERAIARIKFSDWSFRLKDVAGGWLLSVSFQDDGGSMQKGRKWYVSANCCESEIVQTCLLAVLTAVEHEVREKFLFDGEAIYGPHFDAESLLGVRKQMRAPRQIANVVYCGMTADCPEPRTH